MGVCKIVTDFDRVRSYMMGVDSATAIDIARDLDMFNRKVSIYLKMMGAKKISIKRKRATWSLKK